MWLPWKDGAVLCGCLVIVALAIRPRLLGRTGGSPSVRARSRQPRWLAGIRAVASEAAVVVGLYSVWQLAGSVSVMKVTGALERARAIWDVERWLHLPSEAAVQHLVLPHPWLVQALNRFYAIVHGPSMFVFLVWLFVRHRDRYPRARNTVAVVTGACLAIQLVPVAPPRMLVGLGIVDTPLAYHQSVYDALGRGLAYQLSAMPSVHVAWAVLIAMVVITASSSRWRWLVLLDPILTVWAVVATGNHFWLDGIVAVALIPMAAGALTAASILASRFAPSDGDDRVRHDDDSPTPPGGIGPSPERDQVAVTAAVPTSG